MAQHDHDHGDHDHGSHGDHDHGSHDHGSHDHGSQAHHHEPEPGPNLVTCPVMPDNLVNPEQAERRGLYRDYEGKRYWFCCADCPPLWDADPARYANVA